MESKYENRPRARDIGIKIGIMPIGETNSICDIPGLRVGHVTLIQGDGKLIKGKGPIRTGVTAIIPVDDISPGRKPPAAVDVINGFGKSAGTVQINELGEIETPILLTNTLNVGKVSQHLTEWMIDKYPDISSVNPVVMECNDSYLNDIWGMHVIKRACIESVEESIINSLLRSHTIVGRDGNIVNAISINDLRDLLQRSLSDEYNK